MFMYSVYTLKFIFKQHIECLVINSICTKFHKIQFNGAHSTVFYRRRD